MVSGIAANVVDLHFKDRIPGRGAEQASLLEPGEEPANEGTSTQYQADK